MGPYVWLHLVEQGSLQFKALTWECVKVSRLKIGSKFILQNKDRILENLFLESK